MEKQFFVFDEISSRYIGQYFSIEKTLVNSTEIVPISEICEWNGNEWIELSNINIECPPEVALWKIRVILKLMQLEDTVVNALDTLTEPTKTAALYIWNYGTAIDRNSQTVQLLQSILGLTSEQVDYIFIQAQNIQL
jgi:hypothetical protein